MIQRLKDKHGDNMEEVLEDDDESSGEEEDSDAEGTVIYLSIYLSFYNVDVVLDAEHA